jgi:hypothetical protein
VTKWQPKGESEEETRKETRRPSRETVGRIERKGVAEGDEDEKREHTKGKGERTRRKEINECG